MLTIPLQKLCYIIVKAREFDEKEEVVEPDPGSNVSDDKDVEILEDYPDDPTWEELTGAIDGLNEDEQLDLVALAWIGRGDYSGEEWEQARTAADEASDKHFPDYLVGMPQLGDLLEEGMAALGLSCTDYEIGRL
ncbi:Protein of unknown function [Tistlia consotensis]|uniref:DUF3775 domain-containing protein n=1 Tax=Tistlia consotensis USBA 355 TaxID=560819 RepID=A0A1Y6CDA1_9PROT|nr:DUF3775 domain-containing protein [Tistlia consotensis]SMF48422.1 Protein of unknown function [Tistlia consotensis USBA 355]SNR81224.1 Protein of unknown function [Tistlia consotensis]